MLLKSEFVTVGSIGRVYSNRNRLLADTLQCGYIMHTIAYSKDVYCYLSSRHNGNHTDNGQRDEQMSKPATLKTQLITYSFDISDKHAAKDYKKLVTALNSKGIECFNVMGNASRVEIVSGEVELECSTVFNNQWNTSENSKTNKNHRVFDWYEGIYPNTDIKHGHYLVVTDEMRQLRDDTKKCGYCGAHYYKTEQEFCDKCLNSSYLKVAYLSILRLQAVSNTDGRKPLSEDEKSMLIDKFVKAQVFGNVPEKLTSDSEEEQKGMQWLQDADLNTDNVIFYSHRNVFSFGWRADGLDACVAKEWVKVLKDFPCKYVIVTH